MVECYFSTEIGVDVEHRFVLLLAIIKIRLFMSERMCIGYTSMFLYWIIIKEWFKCCFIENHQSYYYILAPTWTAFFYPYFATYYLLAYSSSLLTCSCWDLMVSRSRAMNKSTSSFHS